MYICMDNYCLLCDYVYGRILYLRQFVEMYVTVVFVKLFVQRNEFNSYYRMALYKIKYYYYAQKHMFCIYLPQALTTKTAKVARW